MEFLSGKGEQDPKEKRSGEPTGIQMKKSEGGPKEVSAEVTGARKQSASLEIATPTHKSSSTQETSSKKSMTRA